MKLFKKLNIAMLALVLGLQAMNAVAMYDEQEEETMLMEEEED